MRKLLPIILLVLLAFAPNDAREANEAYERGEYQKAAELYRQALQSDPDNPRLHFNLGNSLANLGQAEEALQAYEQFKNLADDQKERALADYNIGKLLADAGQFDTAANYFREALRGDPDDLDAKYNYELALRNQQNQQQQQPQQDQDQDQNQQDQQQEQQQQDDPDQSPGEQSLEPEMSLEDAQNILEALEQRERELLRDREKDAQEESRDDEKDW